MTDEQRTWDLRHAYHSTWTAAMASPLAGMGQQGCGCLVDIINNGRIWEPCMAHEGQGHLAVISEQDGMFVARCLVLICDWKITEMWETTATEAAQQHWRDTAGTAADGN